MWSALPRYLYCTKGTLKGTFAEQYYGRMSDDDTAPMRFVYCITKMHCTVAQLNRSQLRMRMAIVFYVCFKVEHVFSAADTAFRETIGV